ncbi:MAG: Gfo/Idh/MocA family oxidoreductase [Treponema sp.]|nr:Gfo/Idh/MocA family oxidoreductase [Treponema sp.]
MFAKEKINWALAGTGGIANKFIHGLVAAGGNPAAIVSRSRQNAQNFASHYGIEKAYDDFNLMLEDSGIDAVYIGTPHTTHKDLAISALKAKKAVLCEKPCAINAGELEQMICAAKENNALFMEAMWTRFTPPVKKVRQWLGENLIGDIKMVQANFGFNAPFDPKGRLFDLDLGGGSLLDAGIYPLSMISMVFGGEKPLDIKSHLYFGETGSDDQDAIILSYSGQKTGIASCATRTQMENDTWIYGSRGRIHIPNFIWARNAVLYQDNGTKLIDTPEFISNGYNYEAQEVMDCLKEGKTESPCMTWDESLTIMRTMDKIRAQWDFKYPCEKKNGLYS